MRLLFMIMFISSYLLALNIEKPKVYKEQEISGWVMSEKLDGIRAVWDGKVLRTKNGNIINTPKNFTKNFPAFYLDGELWTTRNDFENIQSIVLDRTPSQQWKQIRYHIFEVPYEKGVFLQRLQQAKDWFNLHPNPNIKFIEQIKCENKQHLEKYLKEIITQKGEGIIIKNPNLDYISKRSSNSLKVKKFFDKEGKVININYNANGLMKSLVIQLDNGITFNLGGGFSKKQRRTPPKVGEVITFKYYGLTKNKKPKFASFLRVRHSE